MVDLDPDVKRDLNGGSDGRESGLEELGRMHENSESSLPQWAEYGIYAAVIIAIIEVMVGIPIPDGTLLVVAGLGFLVLGLWAGYRMHEQLGRVADAINEWRQG